MKYLCAVFCEQKCNADNPSNRSISIEFKNQSIVHWENRAFQNHKPFVYRNERLLSINPTAAYGNTNWIWTYLIAIVYHCVAIQLLLCIIV